MIKTFKVSNFCSIGSPQELSFEISDKDVLDDSARKVPEKKLALNLVACLIGHNASGKTNMLKAITFLFWFVDQSYTSKLDQIFLENHRLKKDEPTAFELEFIHNNTLYLYRLALNKQQTLSEYLGVNIKRGYTRIFEYERYDDSWKFQSSNFLEINPVDLKRFKERKDASVLSSLIQLDYLKGMTFFNHWSSNVNFLGLVKHERLSRETIADLLYKSEELRTNILDFLKDIDLGITDFEFEELNVGKNVDGDKKYNLQSIHFSQQGTFKLNIFEESNGTQSTISLLTQVWALLWMGGVAIFDEVEMGIHPYVAKKLISLFENKKTNPNNAQLIFSTHQHLLLNDRTKTQIYITEKDRDTFETEIFRLDEIEGVRNDENFFHKYIAGTYGGVPEMNFI